MKTERTSIAAPASPAASVVDLAGKRGVRHTGQPVTPEAATAKQVSERLANLKPMSSTPPATALIVVDVQRAFVAGDGASPQMPTVVPAIEQQLESARAADALIVFLQNDGSVGAADEPHTDGWQLALRPRPGEQVVRKDEDNGFTGTNLENTLRQHRVETVSICGVMSEMCVAATARGAMSRGLAVVLAHDSHGTYPVPAYSDTEGEVSATDAARAAEWSLGDSVFIPATAGDVHFSPAHQRDA